MQSRRFAFKCSENISRTAPMSFLVSRGLYLLWQRPLGVQAVKLEFCNMYLYLKLIWSPVKAFQNGTFIVLSSQKTAKKINIKSITRSLPYHIMPKTKNVLAVKYISKKALHQLWQICVSVDKVGIVLLWPFACLFLYRMASLYLNIWRPPGKNDLSHTFVILRYQPSISWIKIFASIYFSRMGYKQWRQKTANTRKTPKILEKGPKMVKIINSDIFAIMYFSQMEFKSRKMDAHEKTRFTVFIYKAYFYSIKRLFSSTDFHVIE